jgi:hypothetical protein
MVNDPPKSVSNAAREQVNLVEEESIVLIKKDKPKRNFLDLLGIDVDAEKHSGPGRKQVHNDLEDLCLRIREKVVNSNKDK